MRDRAPICNLVEPNNDAKEVGDVDLPSTSSKIMHIIIMDFFFFFLTKGLCFIMLSSQNMVKFCFSF